MNAVKPPVSSCSCRRRSKMLDPLGQRFDVAEHHRRRAAAAQLVPHAIDVEPIVGQHFAARDRFAHAIDENFAAAAGQGCPGRPPSVAPAPCRSGSLETLVK